MEPITLCERIKEVSEMDKDERKAYGEKAKDFVLTKKNNVAQMKMVLDFISK